MIFYLVIVATLINQIAFKGSKVLMSLYAMNLGADPFIVGILISLYSLFPLFLAVYAGRLSDRLGPRIPMLIGSLGLACGLLLPFLLPRLATLLVSAAIIGCVYIFYTVSVQHLIGSFGSGEQRTRNFSSFSLGVALSAMFGPTLAGFSIDLAGHEFTYLILALFPTVPAVFFMFFARELPRALLPFCTCESFPDDEADLTARPRNRAHVLLGDIAEVDGLDVDCLHLPKAVLGESIGEQRGPHVPRRPQTPIGPVAPGLPERASGHDFGVLGRLHLHGDRHSRENARIPSMVTDTVVA